MHSSRHLATALLAASLVTAAIPAQLVPKLNTRPAPSASATLTGKWTGTAVEQTAESGEVSFPIELTFRGRPDALELDVTGRGQIPIDGGERVTFVIEATYRGALRGDELAMRSERVQTRILEYDELIPSEPQSLTARLAAGELRGRVGSDDEGWTSFTARRSGAETRPEPAGATGLIGAWRGTASETGPDGRPMSYVLEARFADDSGALRADLSADLRYPTQDGGSVPIEYRAAFRGTANGGQLKLDSDSVQYRIVPQNRTEAGARQRATGRLDGDVLHLTLTTEGNAPTQVDLRRVAAGPQQGNDEEVVVEDRETPNGGASTTTPAAYSTLVLEPLQIRDPGLGNAHSHTLMKPQGWRFEGGVQWTSNPDQFVHFVGAMSGTEQEEITFGKSLTLEFSTFNGQPAFDPRLIGTEQANGSIVRQPPQRYGEVAADVLLPRLRPGATDVRLVEATRLPEVEQQLRAVYGETLRMLEQSIEMARRDGAAVPDTVTDANLYLVAERSRIRYRQNGREWEEEFRSTQLGQNHSMRTSYAATESSMCGIFDVRSYRAPIGQLDGRLPTLLSLAGTLRETPNWSTAIHQMRMQIAQARAAGRQAAFQAAQRTAATTASSDISDIQMKGWRDRQDSIDRMQKATVESIHETHDFRHSDGSTYTFTNTFDRAFMNAGGQVVLTNDTGLQPSADPRFGGVNWQEMQRIDPFRRN